MLTLKIKAYNLYGELMRRLLAPAFAPLFKEMYDQHKRLVAIAMDQHHYFVDDEGYVKERKVE